jgi:RNA polymerase sigma-70 factor (ECF subfamily)
MAVSLSQAPRPPTAGPPEAGAADEDLLWRHVLGDAHAFREVVERHQQWLYGYLVNETRCPETARDLFQEIFLRVARGAAGFRERSRFSTWLFAITSNVLRSHRRRQLRERLKGIVAVSFDSLVRDPPRPSSAGAESAVLEAVPDPRPGPDCEYEGRERLARVQEALTELPEKQRRALLLVKVEGLSLDDAASTLGLNVNTVKTLLRRGRLGLAKRLAEGEGP